MSKKLIKIKISPETDDIEDKVRELERSHNFIMFVIERDPD